MREKGYTGAYLRVFMPLLIVTILIVVAVAALFAVVEAALFSTSMPRVQILKRQGKIGSNALLSIKENMSRPITTLVIGNNVATIVGSIFVGHVATEAYGNDAIGFVSAGITITIIVFGEVFPKVLGERYCEPIALYAARPILFLTALLSPLTWILEKGTSRFTRDRKKVVSEEELKILSEIGSKEGSIEKDEEELIRRAFTLNDMVAKDIMTPRNVVDMLPGTKTVAEVASEVTHKPYSRYPVWDSSPEGITGIVQAKDLLIALARDGQHELVSHYMHTPLFVRDTMRVDNLLAQFLAGRKHMAIVKNQAGKFVGVITLEDVMEQLVGEIVDESDEVVDMQKLSSEMPA